MSKPTVEAWLAAQADEVRGGIECLRRIVLAVEAPWEESIKWNAPSFAINGEDRVTLGVERKGGWRVVLHRGAAARDDDFRFDDLEGLARWPTSDRGVVTLRSFAEVETVSPALTDLVSRWVEATR